MGVWLYATRIPALTKHRIVYDPQRPSEEFHAQLPAEVRWKADNHNNLLEQPTIFYAVALTLAFLNAGSGLNAGLAWLYVALRISHSLVQVLVTSSSDVSLSPDSFRAWRVLLTAESGHVPGWWQPSYTVSIMEFRDGKVVRETQYFGDPFEPGPSRVQWVERML